MTAATAGAFGFPIMVEVRGVPVVVAGGGREAPVKARALTALGARVRFWTAPPASVERDAAVAGDGSAALVAAGFRPELLDGARLAVIDTGDRALDRSIAAEARHRRVLVNVVDDPGSCDWSAPAILRRGDLTVAIASAGVAPALASRLRDQLRSVVGPEYAELVELFAAVRPAITASGRPFADRRRLWYELVDGPALDLLRSGRRTDARRAIEDAIGAWKARR